MFAIPPIVRRAAPPEVPFVVDEVAEVVGWRGFLALRDAGPVERVRVRPRIDIVLLERSEGGGRGWWLERAGRERE